MSDVHDAPAAAWYPDPQTPGQVRWWDGTNWTEHVSVPAPAMNTAVPQVAEADAALAAADAEHVEALPGNAAPATYIGRHAAGAQPAPRQAPTAPRIRPRERPESAPGTAANTPVQQLSYA